MKNQKATIATQIGELQANVVDGNWKEAARIAEALAGRRIPKEHRELFAQLVAEVQEEVPTYSMASHIALYRARYQACHTASGNKSLNNGDDLANFLEGKEPKEVCLLADRWTPIKGGQTHQERYDRLNPGQQRMNAGNKLRAAAKNGLIVVGEHGIEAA